MVNLSIQKTHLCQSKFGHWKKFGFLIVGQRRTTRRKFKPSDSSGTSSSGKLSTSYFTNIIERLKQQKHQPRTRRTYHGIWKNFNEFIIQLDKIPPKWEHKLKLYCAFLVQEAKLQSSTIRSYASAIKQTLIIDGYIWDDELFLMSLFTNSCKLKNDKVKTRLPIHKGLLEMILFELENIYLKSNIHLHPISNYVPGSLLWSLQGR